MVEEERGYRNQENVYMANARKGNQMEHHESIHNVAQRNRREAIERKKNKHITNVRRKLNKQERKWTHKDTMRRDSEQGSQDISTSRPTRAKRQSNEIRKIEGKECRQTIDGDPSF